MNTQINQVPREKDSYKEFLDIVREKGIKAGYSEFFGETLIDIPAKMVRVIEFHDGYLAIELDNAAFSIDTWRIKFIYKTVNGDYEEKELRNVKVYVHADRDIVTIAIRE